MVTKTRSGQTHIKKARAMRHKVWAADTLLEYFSRCSKRSLAGKRSCLHQPKNSNQGFYPPNTVEVQYHPVSTTRYGGDDMRQKAYWDRPSWEFPSNTPPVPNGDDGALFVDPYDPVIV